MVPGFFLRNYINTSKGIKNSNNPPDNLIFPPKLIFAMLPLENPVYIPFDVTIAERLRDKSGSCPTIAISSTFTDLIKSIMSSGLHPLVNLLSTRIFSLSPKTVEIISAVCTALVRGEDAIILKEGINVLKLQQISDSNEKLQ